MGVSVVVFAVWAGRFFFFFLAVWAGAAFSFAVRAGGVFLFFLFLFFLFGLGVCCFFFCCLGGVRGCRGGWSFFFFFFFFFFSVWAGDGSSLTYRSAWLVFKRPNNKKDQTAKKKKNTGSPLFRCKKLVPQYV